jgi:predicted transcriptional regulator
MFEINDNITTTRTQLEDKSIIDEIIESKIKDCQRENGRLMTRTSQRLRERYGIEMVDRVVNRLSRRRQRKNQNLKKREIINQLGKLFIDNGSI